MVVQLCEFKAVLRLATGDLSNGQYREDQKTREGDGEIFMR